MRRSSASRVLYIDGSRDGDELISTLRRAENTAYRISTANTPNDALELIVAEPFDLFILEHSLPEMSGVELCRRIRRTDKKTPILFFTGKSRLADCEVAIAAGATEYLVKPFGAEYLLETIRRLLHDRSAAKSKNQPACCLAK
ncbi:MAG TPA: response regulator [Pyrinomonadaceae bacterium]